MQTKRLFVALDMPQLFLAPVQEVQKQLLQSGCIEGRAIPADHIHLTLQFIGAVMPERVAMIADALSQIKFNSFELHLDGLFLLPNQQEPRVVVIDVIAPELAQLVEAIRRALRAVTTLDEREFLPHVTLIRVKKVIDTQKLADILTTLRVAEVAAGVEEFVLRESVLSHEGAVHSDVMKYRLM